MCPRLPQQVNQLATQRTGMLTSMTSISIVSTEFSSRNYIRLISDSDEEINWIEEQQLQNAIDASVVEVETTK